MRRRVIHTGFTLIEVMIAVAIVAILLAVALPSYQDSVRKGYRRQAQADLLAAAQAVERSFSTRLTFVGATLAPAQSPTDGDAAYTFALTATANTFTIVASAVSGGPAAGEGPLRINHLGQRAWDRAADGFGDDDNSWED